MALGLGWMKSSMGIALAATLALAGVARGETLRIGAQKSGTFGWELSVIKARGLDKAAGLDLEVTDLATTEAGKIAISGGSVDMVITDWLWVSRERSQGRKLVFAPYSSALGGVMAKSDAGVADLVALKGKSLGVAGGPLDKSWLLLRAYAKKSGLDIAHDARIVYGAPPLLAEKAAQGEIDATLQFWNFCADLEQRGFRSVVDMREVEKGLGASDAVAMVGYVLDEDFAAKHADAVSKFLAISKQAKDILAGDETLWPEIMVKIGQKDPAAAAIYRKRYADGVPRRPLADEERDAAVLFKTLAEIGGAELVGSASALDPGTYYRPKE